MIPEELMEELYTLIYHTDLDGFERIEQAITRIGKAVLSGESEELDEMLGVVGRGNGVALVFEDGDVWATWTEAFPVDKSLADNTPLIFIALRKEERNEPRH